MTKISFILTLHEKLSDLPQKDVDERLGFYCEMIEDRMEDGLSEEDAVAAIGSIEEIATQIRADILPDNQVVRPVNGKRKWKAWEIVLLAVGSPVWVSLLIAAFAVVFALYVALWAVVISLWAVFAAFVGCAVGGFAGGIILACNSNVPIGLALVGAALVCAGLSILLFFGCKAASKGTVLLAKKMYQGIRKCFANREVAE